MDIISCVSLNFFGYSDQIGCHDNSKCANNTCLKLLREYTRSHIIIMKISKNGFANECVIATANST
jgi:hypothetical protein